MQAPRVVIDAICEKDREALINLYTDQDVRRFLGGTLTVDNAVIRVSTLLSTLPALNWAIRGGADRPLLGTISLDTHHDGDDIEVSYALLPRAQGKGCATSALRSTLHHAFTNLQLPRVIAETQTANEKSIALLLRVGMRPLRNVIRFNAEQTIFSIDAQTFLNDSATTHR